MRTGKSVATFLVLTLVLAAVPVIGMADDNPAKSILTFNQPVEIPGVVLPAGTYIFKFDNVKNTLQVWDAKENKIYATLLTTVTYNNESTSKTTVRFDDRGTSAPQALKTIIPANQTTGHELTYPVVAGH